jgi:hypothetical protein
MKGLPRLRNCETGKWRAAAQSFATEESDSTTLTFCDPCNDAGYAASVLKKKMLKVFLSSSYYI